VERNETKGIIIICFLLTEHNISSKLYNGSLGMEEKLA
jgi:hypothetical protein